MIVAVGSDGKKRTYKSNTSKEINFALLHQGNVTLDPAKTYSILDSLLFSSDSTLDGNGAILKLAKGLPIWGGAKVSISQEKAMLMIRGDSAQNVTIKNLTIDGSQADYYPRIKLGTSCFNLATIICCKNLTIENCTFKNSCNDAILLNKCSDVEIDKITVNKCGHDGVYAYRCDNVNVTNSNFINRTNCSCRLYSVNTGSFTNNKSSTSGGGGSGLQFQGSDKHITVRNNLFYGLPYPGILGINAVLSDVKIENNVIQKCKSPGISGVTGAYLKNNKII